MISQATGVPVGGRYMAPMGPAAGAAGGASFRSGGAAHAARGSRCCGRIGIMSTPCIHDQDADHNVDLEKDGLTGMSRLHDAGDKRGYAFLVACMLQALCPVVARGQPRPLGALEEIMRDTVAEPGSTLTRGPSFGPCRGRRFEVWFGHLIRTMRDAAELEEHGVNDQGGHGVR